VEEAVRVARSLGKKSLCVVDFGTGTGCLIISIAKDIESMLESGCAVDISADALKVRKMYSSHSEAILADSLL
jgi:methylase of polypeptide subunit release factors